MENSPDEHIVIVGAGIGGLTTALVLHRMGIRSIVLESSESLRTAGFAFTTWTNAWKVLDTLDLGDQLRQHHQRIIGIVVNSLVSEQQTAYLPYTEKGKHGDRETRCIRRNMLLEALGEQLPSDTIRYCSKVVAIEELANLKLVHLADGTVHRAKVLIGCDGVNSVVAKWLGFKKLASTGRAAIRGLVDFKENHGLEPKFQQFFGSGFRSGLIPCDDKTVYWFFTWSPTDEELEEDPIKLKHLVLTKARNMPDYFRDAIENTRLEDVLLSTLKYRYPWEILKGNISKGNVCVVGDAFHPMTPGIGQGACSTLEDSIVLARCLAEALSENPSIDEEYKTVAREYKKIDMALKKYAKERKWRAIDLVTTSYIVGYLQESSSKVTSFLRDKLPAAPLARLLQNKADYECGNLVIPP